MPQPEEEIPIRISTPRWTFFLTCNRAGIITYTAPVATAFLSQPLSNLTSWLHKTHGQVQVKRLPTGEEKNFA